MSTMYSEVQRQDWQDRDFIEIISRNIKRISDFLNLFDQSCRGKLAELNEKVTHLERQIEFLEASINGAAVQSQNDLKTTTIHSSSNEGSSIGLTQQQQQ